MLLRERGEALLAAEEEVHMEEMLGHLRREFLGDMGVSRWWREGEEARLESEDSLALLEDVKRATAWANVRFMGGCGGVCGAGETPWILSKQSSQTRELTTGEAGELYAEIGTLRGGWKKLRLEVSRRGVARDEQAAQKTPPHLRQ